MKYNGKLMVFFLFMLFSYGSDIFGYTFTITNMTGRDVKVELRWVLGKLNKKGKNDNFIKKYDTYKFRLGGWETGLCLTKIMVSIQDSTGKWKKAKEAKIRVAKSEDRFQQLKKSGFIGKAGQRS